MADGFGQKMNQVNLNWIKGTTTAVPVTEYVAGYSADPGDSGDTDEIAVGAYARQAVTAATAWSALVSEDGGERITNDVVIQFPDPTAAYTMTHVAIKSAAVAGDTYFSGALDTPITVEAGGAPIVFPVGMLKLGSGT